MGRLSGGLVVIQIRPFFNNRFLAVSGAGGCHPVTGFTNFGLGDGRSCQPVNGFYPDRGWKPRVDDDAVVLDAG